VRDQIVLPLEEPTASGGRSLTVRRSVRVRRLALRVHLDERIDVVVPRGVLMSSIKAFVTRHQDWLVRKRTVRTARVVTEPFPPAEIPLSGLQERYRVHLAGGRGRLRVERRGVVLSLRGALNEATISSARRTLLTWLTTHSREALEVRLQQIAFRWGFKYHSLQLRRQRTRWGSCSSRGVISLNVCAVFQEPEVLDYLLVHELVHTRYMNHSAAYWGAVAEMCPDWKRLDRELSQGWKRIPPWVFA